MTKIPFELTIQLPAEGLDEGSDVDFFSLKESTIRKISFFLSLQQPRTSHEYCRRVFVMLTMPRKVLQHVNWSSLVVLSPPV